MSIRITPEHEARIWVLLAGAGYLAAQYWPGFGVA
jgi:hypothetical protein